MIPSREEKNWALALHVSTCVSFITYLAPIIAGLAFCIVVWKWVRPESPYISRHAKEVINFQISLLIYTTVAGILVLAAIGVILLPLLGIIGFVLSIYGAVKAADGLSLIHI